ncbi:MAG: fimbrillin family protein, partial [Muribaculaceae bacterium]|nr:fimbrillin family protein [Muribaculaceae bacterium]
MLVSLTSCSDDELDSPSSSRTIRFKVVATEAWSRSTGASGNGNTGSLSTVTLDADGQKLYLIPEVTAGIDIASTYGNVASRSEATTNDNISGFGVYASVGNGSESYYMDNVEVTKDNNWAPRKEYLWPGNGTLHINAYAPYRSAGDSNSGIMSLPSADATETPKIRFSVPEDVADQIDLLWATPRDASTSPCEMTFNHALAAVRFVTGTDMVPCTVKSISISGLLSDGTLDLENGTWTETSGQSSYTAPVDVSLAAPDGQEYVEPGIAVTDDASTFMLLPQQLGDKATVSIVIDYNGTDIEYNASLDGQTWSAGNTYTY